MPEAAEVAGSKAPPATPIFFASQGRPLYAVHHAPAVARPGAPVVVHCHTLGVEQLTSYRAEAQAARAAAARGYHAFRFHARGHGDSSGNFADVTLEGLVEDAEAAAEEAKRRAGAQTVLWLGLRFGAVVAATALRRRIDTAGLALWEPVHRPADYFRAMLRGMLFSQAAKGKVPDADVPQLLEAVENEGQVDVHGYYLHRAVVRSSEGADLAQLLGEWSGPTLLIQIQQRRKLAPAHASFVEVLRARGAQVTVRQVVDEPGWHFVTNPGWEGTQVVERMAEWLDALD
jgi:hypothetical protein